MELNNIYIVCPQIPEAGFQMLVELCRIFGHGFGGNKDLTAHIGQGRPDLFFTVCIASGCIKKADPSVKSAAQKCLRLFHRDALDRQCAEAVFPHSDAGPAKGDCLHAGSSLSHSFIFCIITEFSFSEKPFFSATDGCFTAKRPCATLEHKEAMGWNSRIIF